MPFYLRTGKRMPRKLSQIVVQFRPVPHRMFPSDAADVFEPNRLIINIQPEEGIVLKFQAKEPGSGMRLRNVSMDFNYGDAFHAQNREAYETLLQEVMEGDATLFMRNDQEHEAWKIVMPILEAWGDARERFPNYASGTWGTRSGRHHAREGRPLMAQPDDRSHDALMRIDVCSGPEGIAEAAAAVFLDAYLRHEGEFVVALSGGSTPKRLHALLATLEIDWGRVDGAPGRRPLRRSERPAVEQADGAEDPAGPREGRAGSFPWCGGRPARPTPGRWRRSCLRST